MKELIEYIVKSLVEDKQAVKVEIEQVEEETHVLVSVAEADKGRVIGKGGRIASSIRTLAKSIYGKNKQKVFVKFE